MPDRPEPDKPRQQDMPGALTGDHDSGHHYVDNRTPAQKDADKLGALENQALTTDNAGDRQAALKGIQDEAHDLSKQGLDYAKSVYTELAKRDAGSQTVPLVELTDGKLSLKGADAVQAIIAKEQDNPDVKFSRNLNQELRKDYGLPNSASEAQLQTAETKENDAALRKDYGLPVTASDKELQAAEDKQLQADLRKDYGLPVTASDKELQAAEDKQLQADLRKSYGLPVTASDKELQAAEDAQLKANPWK
jgi:hypothetical protein